MKFKIVHESRGRVRIQVMQKRMTLEQADRLEAYLNHSPAIRQAAVHERTCCCLLYTSQDHTTVGQRGWVPIYGIPEQYQ